MADVLRRLLRGGSWDYSPRNCRSASRNDFHFDDRHDIVGFRICCPNRDDHTIQLKEQTDDWTIYFRLIRGGSWDNRSSDCRSACRGVGLPGLASSDAGFRMVCLHQAGHAIRLEEQADA